MSSALLAVEALRACARYGEAYADAARDAVAAVALVPLDDAVLRVAAELALPELRTLDALHLATAMSLGEDLGAFVCYDGRLNDAAQARGLPVRAPA